LDQTVKLTDQAIFGSGNYRDAYIHPSNPNLVLKIIRREYSPIRIGAFGMWRSAPLDPNQMEFNMWQSLVASGHEASGYFCRVLGWIDTDLGQALCVERIINDDGTKVLVLGNLRHRSKMVKNIDMKTRDLILSCLDDYYDYLSHHAIYSLALRLENIAFYTQNGVDKIKSFDAKLMPLREWIPITQYFKFARRLKVRRRTAELRNDLAIIFGLEKAN
jgi:hypothetical protein